MKKTLTRIALVVIVAALVGVGIWYKSRPNPIPVTVATVGRGLVESTVANTRAGTIKAYRRAKVAPTTSGRVVDLPVHMGDHVKAGDLLLQLWNDDVKAELQVAQARAKAAKARADQACIMADSSARESQRLQSLKARGLTSAESADRAASESDAARSSCHAARADADLAAASVTTARAALSRTELRAPFDGVVAEVNAELGEIVSPSPPGIPTPPAVDLVDLSSLYVSAPIDEVDAPQVRLGMPARVTLDAFPGRTFQGRVSRIAPYVLDVEKQARTVEIEVAFTQPSEATGLLPGYSADVEVILQTHEDTLRVPTEALLEGNRVLVLGADGILHGRTVKSGLSNWQYTEVLSGLQPGDRVVLSVNRPGVKDGALAKAES